MKARKVSKVAIIALAVMLALMGVPVFTSSAGAAEVGSRGILNSGHMMGPGATLTSPNGCFRLEMQTDGNAVVYGMPKHVAIWSSRTPGHPGSRLVMQSDGNLVLYAMPTHVAIWTSHTHAPSSRLEMQNDGNLVVYAMPTHVALWSSKTSYGCGGTASKASKVVSIAKQFATGKHATVSRTTENVNRFTRWYYGNSYKAEWCAIFVSYAFSQAGVPLKRLQGLGPGSASTFDWKSGSVFAQSGAKIFAFTKTVKLRPGDVLFRLRDGGGHVGIVEWQSGSTLRTIQGNLGKNSLDAAFGVSEPLSTARWTTVIRAPGF